MKVCVIGHRKIMEKDKLLIPLTKVIKHLIVNKNVDTFLFGGRSDFDDLAWRVVSSLKEKQHKQIKRVFVRAEYKNITNDYKKYLLNSYEDTYYAIRCTNAGRKTYVIRNECMIDESDYCIFYINENYKPMIKEQPKKLREFLPPIILNSGTKLAFKYANKKKKKIICINQFFKISVNEHFN